MSEKKFVELEVNAIDELTAMDFAKEALSGMMVFTILNSMVNSLRIDDPIHPDDVEIVYKAGTWRLRIPLKEADE